MCMRMRELIMVIITMHMCVSLRGVVNATGGITSKYKYLIYWSRLCQTSEYEFVPTHQACVISGVVVAVVVMGEFGAPQLPDIENMRNNVNTGRAGSTWHW